MPIAVDNKIIESTFKEYFKHLANKEHSKAIDYIYPPLFKIIPRETILSIMRQGEKSVVIQLTGMSIEKISPPKSTGQINYVVLYYGYTLTMTFPKHEVEAEEDEIDEAPEEKEQDQLTFTFEILKNKYGKKNVTIDRDKLQLIANVKSQVYCFSDPDFKGWKFLEKKKGTEALLKKLLE